MVTLEVSNLYMNNKSIGGFSMKNRKIVLMLSSIIFISAIIAICFFVGARSKTNPKDEVVGAKLVGEYNSLEDLTEASILIIDGTKVSEGKPILLKDKYDIVAGGYTLSTIRVDKIVSDHTGINIKVNDTITVLENEYYNKETNTNYHIEGYKKMKNKKSYMLFLTYASENQWYIPTGVIYGKIPHDAKEEILVEDYDGSDIVVKKIRDTAYKNYKIGK